MLSFNLINFALSVKIVFTWPSITFRISGAGNSGTHTELFPNLAKVIDAQGIDLGNLLKIEFCGDANTSKKSENGENSWQMPRTRSTS
jgi:hypothetical protein